MGTFGDCQPELALYVGYGAATFLFFQIDVGTDESLLVSASVIVPDRTIACCSCCGLLDCGCCADTGNGVTDRARHNMPE